MLLHARINTQQVRFLMAHAREKGVAEKVVAAFGNVVAAAVGKVTTEAIREEGIERVIVPAEERMGSMMVALSRYFEENGC